MSARVEALKAVYQAFQSLTAAVGNSLAALEMTGDVDPAFDELCHWLERDCAGLRCGLETMRDIIDLLPIHAVMTRLFPTYCLYLDEQELWNLERMAREYYESLVLQGVPEQVAYDGARDACVSEVLKRLGRHDLSDIPDDICWLIQAVVFQVKMLLARRDIVRPA